jgi:hypothetical protein
LHGSENKFSLCVHRCKKGSRVVVLGAMCRKTYIEIADFLEGEERIFVNIFYLNICSISAYALI